MQNTYVCINIDYGDDWNNSNRSLDRYSKLINSSSKKKITCILTRHQLQTMYFLGVSIIPMQTPQRNIMQ